MKGRHLRRCFPRRARKCTAIRSYSVPQQRDLVENDYAFEFKATKMRVGQGVTGEIGKDLAGLNVKSVCVVTDKNMVDMPCVKKVLDSIAKEGLDIGVYQDVFVEPTDKSFFHAMEYGRSHQYDAYVSVGGGSSIDTAKVMNLFGVHRDAEFMDFVNAPVGRGLPVPEDPPLKPHFAIPTTSGTGSETTGIAVCDLPETKAKTGIASRLLTPTMALIDPENALTMPNGVMISSGFDVLCHAIESFTAKPYNDRPLPNSPAERPAYQGSNPISDVWCRSAIPAFAQYFKRAVDNPDDMEARGAMLLNASFAGMGFGSAGVHLCHGCSYPISAQNTGYIFKDYEKADKPLIPHGISVTLPAPAVFRFTGRTEGDPLRHIEAAKMMGLDVSHVKSDDCEAAGNIIADAILNYMDYMGVPMGLTECGYTTDDIPSLVAGTLPQHRVTKLCPGPVNEETLTEVFADAMKY